MSFWLPINQFSAQMYVGSFFSFIINIVYFKQFFGKLEEKFKKKKKKKR